MGVQPANDQEQQDVREVLAAFGGRGHWSNDEIHRRHTAIVTAQGRQPMHPVRLGQVLAEYGVIRKAKWDGSKDRGPGKRPGYMVKGWLL
jgi:hypothetical protein